MPQPPGIFLRRGKTAHGYGGPLPVTEYTDVVASPTREDFLPVFCYFSTGHFDTIST